MIRLVSRVLSRCVFGKRRLRHKVFIKKNIKKIKNYTLVDIGFTTVIGRSGEEKKMRPKKRKSNEAI